MSLVDDIRRNLFERLSAISETYSEIALNTLDNDEYKLLGDSIDTHSKRELFKSFQLEIIDETIYRIMELIDGYDDGFKYELDLIDKESKESIKDGIQFHDKFMDYTYERNKDDRSLR
ncbi:hypothetical protein [Paenibacillus sp. LjRoot56]|uniref:hypothetical protein n=1 Tax=Paenibacillus sp. LjRoot56 TaxID=3342333 RepID=UPI003ED07078